MEKATYATTRFDVGNDYYVEIMPTIPREDGMTNLDEFFLCNKYGDKRFMFYLPQGREDRWEDCIQAVLDEEIKKYEEYLNYIEMIDIFYHEHNKIN